VTASPTGRDVSSTGSVGRVAEVTHVTLAAEQRRYRAAADLRAAADPDDD
jgi:hypothetical protein